MLIKRLFRPGDRYEYDFILCTVSNGFAQVDTSQDACYFGTWASPEQKIIITYAEGDVTIVKCESEEEFADEIHKLKAWNEGHGWKFYGIDCGGFSEKGKQLEDEFRSLGLSDYLYQ